jgi:predicted transposase/invertase (TIGR01784 family)
MLFIDGKSKEVMEMAAQKNQDINTAYDLLKIISKEEKARMAYEAREAELMDQRTRIKSAHEKGWAEGKAEGKAEGRVEGKAEIIESLLKSGMTVEQIATITQVPLTEITKIQKGMRIIQ